MFKCTIILENDSVEFNKELLDELKTMLDKKDFVISDSIMLFSDSICCFLEDNPTEWVEALKNELKDVNEHFVGAKVTIVELLPRDNSESDSASDAVTDTALDESESPSQESLDDFLAALKAHGGDSSEEDTEEDDEDEDASLRDDRINRQLDEIFGGDDSDEEENDKPSAITEEEKLSPSFFEQTRRRKRRKSGATDINTLLSAVDKLSGAKEFKALIQELVDTAPVYAELGIQSIFMSYNYIVAINSGCGLTTAVTFFMKVVEALGIAEYGSRVPREVKLNPQLGGSEKAEFLQAMYRYKDNSCFIIDLTDVDENYWTAEPDVFDCLAEIAETSTVFFRTSFDAIRSMGRIAAILGDRIQLRNLVIPPLEDDELLEVAAYQLGRIGFEVADSAKDIILKKIAEEKSDGSFFGLRTMKKIVTDIVQSKVNSNVQNKCHADKTITADNIRGILTGGGKSDTKTAEEELAEIIGLDIIKRELYNIVEKIRFAKTSAKRAPTMHMQFVGAPGTGKTTIARIIGKILKEEGLLEKGILYEINARELCGQYIGETAIKTSRACKNAYGSILFIDEAYALATGKDNSKDYGKEAINTLITHMENHAEELIVIFAGYEDDMQAMLDANDGLRSRLPYKLVFKPYSREQLLAIFMQFAHSEFEVADELEATARKYFTELSDKIVEAKHFGNGRFVRNLYEKVWGEAAIRMRMQNETGKLVLTSDDFTNAVMHEQEALLGDASAAAKKRKFGF